jgi:hypothetical protein
MIQFYFLSILFNALAGFILFTDTEEAGVSIEDRFGLSVNNETFRLVLGILAGVTGLLKLLSRVDGDVPVIGDLIPALAGFISGFILIFSYYRERSTIEGGRLQIIGNRITANKKWIGLAVLVSAVLHFLFPQALLL